MPTINAVLVVGDEFVGRGWELARLDVVLDDVARGRGRVVVVTGEAGIGKTALLDAAARRAGARGFAVAVGRCAASEAPPYWPWPQALRSLDGDGDAATVEAHTIPGGRPAFFAAAAERLERLSRGRPAFVVVDDLHWADESSLALATFLVAAVTGLPVSVAFGVRDEPADMRPGVQTMLDGLPADVERIPLGGLDERDTAELLRAVLAHDPTPSIVAEVYSRTAGNPFFVKEVGRLVAAQGERAAAGVPEGVRKVLTRRLARLSRRAFDVLAAAAVADDFDPELLAALADLPAPDVAAHLDEALVARLAVLDEGRYGFAHALVRQTILDVQPSVQRIEAHRSAAVVLESRIEHAAPGLRAAVAGRAAAHWAQVPGDGRSKAAMLAVVAARAAAGQLGFEQAARLYRWARELGDDEVETLTALGEAEVLAGRFAEGRRTLALAAEQARSARRGEALARAVLAAGTGIGGFEVDVRDERQVVLLNEALALLGEDDSGLRAAALARVALIDTRLPEDQRVELADGARAIAVRLGDVALDVSALAARCDILSGPDHVDERLATSDRMVVLAERHGDPFMVLLARRHRLLALLERGRIGQVDDEIAAYARISERLRVPLFSWTVPLWRGMRALLDGDIDGAMECCAVADQLGRAAESHNADTLVLTQRFEIARASGSTASLDGDVRRMVRAYEGYPPVDGMRAVHALLTGRQDDARRVLRRRMSAGLESVPRDSEWLETLWNLGDVAVVVGEREAAGQIYDALAPYSDLWVVDGVGAACYGVVAHLLGRLAISLERGSDARRWLQEAHDAHAAAGVDALVRVTAGLLETVDPHAQPAAAASVVDHGEFVRSGSVWQVRWRDVSATVSHSKGLLDIARLLEHPGREVHALDLVDATGSMSRSGDAGPMLDDAARRSYARRLRDLEEDLADATAAADDGRITRIDHEREFLLAELSRAYGVGGRVRTAADPTERARKAVGMRIATALRAIAVVHPQLARHLDRSLITGRFCSYQPESPTTWTVECDTAGATG